MANAAFFAGLVRALADEDRPLWSQMSFSAASENFAAGVRHGIAADVYWPQIGQVSVVELVLRKLLPLAAEGLRLWEVDEGEIGRLLDIIERRCVGAVNGATWQTAAVANRERDGSSRADALRDMLASYVEAMHSNEPVHNWEVR